MNDVAVTRQERPTWPQFIEQVAPQFKEIATQHKLVTWAEESQFAMQAFQTNTALGQCKPDSVRNAIINVASIGLTLNPALGFAYLVPENGSCNLKVSFKGLMKIATDSGSIKWAKAEVVKENDQFTYNGPCTLPDHQMQPFGDRGKTIGAYCIAKTHDGDFLVDVLPRSEIDKIKGAAKTKNVWNTWEDEMIKKAAIKRASKQWPKTDRDDRLDLAVSAVNESEGSEDMPRQERDITPKEPEPREKQLISEDRLGKAIDRINAGEFSVKKLNELFELTPEQVERVQSECAIEPEAEQ